MLTNWSTVIIILILLHVKYTTEGKHIIINTQTKMTLKKKPLLISTQSYNVHDVIIIQQTCNLYIIVNTRTTCHKVYSVTSSKDMGSQECNNQDYINRVSL